MTSVDRSLRPMRIVRPSRVNWLRSPSGPPRGLRRDHPVQPQVRHRWTKPGVLRLKLVQALHLIALQPARLGCASDRTWLPSPRSAGSPRQPADPAPSALQPAAASRRSLQARAPCPASDTPAHGQKPHLSEDQVSGGKTSFRSLGAEAGPASMFWLKAQPLNTPFAGPSGRRLARTLAKVAIASSASNALRSGVSSTSRSSA